MLSASTTRQERASLSTACVSWSTATTPRSASTRKRGPADAGGFSAPERGRHSSPAESSGQADAGYDPDNPGQPGLRNASTDATRRERGGCRLCAGGPLALSAASRRRAAAERPADAAAAAGAALVVPGRHYVVREVLFRLAVPGEPELNWRAFVEPESRAVLYLRALTSSATCAVFETDPIAKTGVVMTAASPPATLDAARTLGLAVAEPQSAHGRLAGPERHAHARPGHHPAAGAPPAPLRRSTSEYPAPSPDFAASNAYYHTDWMYRLVEGMGFNLATYFNGTAFPVPVDHAGMGNSVNAQAPGNAAGNGVGRFLYGLVQSGQTMGMATQVGVCLHEFAHALLWDHVNSPNFGWCHSAGDSLAALMMDPRLEGPGPLRDLPLRLGRHAGHRPPPRPQRRGRLGLGRHPR